jgi:hypothetical protein
VKHENSCPLGYTVSDLAAIGLDTPAFTHWMRGQGMIVCDGLEYNREHGDYVISECGHKDFEHGSVVFTWDVARFMRKQ